MIKTIILVIILLLYFRFGIWIFDRSVEYLGGKEAYLYEMGKERPKCNVGVAYIIAGLLVMSFWPYFVLMSLIRRDK